MRRWTVLLERTRPAADDLVRADRARNLPNVPVETGESI